MLSDILNNLLHIQFHYFFYSNVDKKDITTHVYFIMPLIMIRLYSDHIWTNFQVHP